MWLVTNSKVLWTCQLYSWKLSWLPFPSCPCHASPRICLVSDTLDLALELGFWRGWGWFAPWCFSGHSPYLQQLARKSGQKSFGSSYSWLLQELTLTQPLCFSGSHSGLSSWKKSCTEGCFSIRSRIPQFSIFLPSSSAILFGYPKLSREVLFFPFLEIP